MTSGLLQAVVLNLSNAETFQYSSSFCGEPTAIKLLLLLLYDCNLATIMNHHNVKGVAKGGLDPQIENHCLRSVWGSSGWRRSKILEGQVFRYILRKAVLSILSLLANIKCCICLTYPLSEENILNDFFFWITELESTKILSSIPRTQVKKNPGHDGIHL